jgi:hypothetical protein
MSAVITGGFARYSTPVRTDPLRTEEVRTSPRRSRLRMTKRGRAVLLALVAIPVVLCVLALGINAGGATATSSSTPLAKITVVGGQTLWSVAKQIAPNADPRDVIADVMSVNRMSTADIYPGERLAIPAQYSHR